MKQILDMTNFSSANFRSRTRAFCPSCQKPVGLMSVKQTAGFYKTSVEEISRLQKKLALHPLHNSRGEQMICENSLFSDLGERKPQMKVKVNHIILSPLAAY